MLYLDMDGVLMDFDRAVREAGIRNDGYYHTPVAEWTPEQQDLHASIVNLLDQPTFWPSVKPMWDAHILWSWCRPYDPHVLTAVLAEAVDPAHVGECKRNSILRNFDSVYPLASHFHLCLRADKRLLAKEGHVLVDDNPGNCQEWETAGGTAILHRDALATIHALQDIYHG